MRRRRGIVRKSKRFAKKSNGTSTAPLIRNPNQWWRASVLKRAVMIVVLAASSACIWIASSPISLQADVLAHTIVVPTTPAVVTVSRISTHSPQQNSAVASEGPRLTTPAALLLQGMIFLACGSFWPKKRKLQTALLNTRRDVIISESGD